jgi:hypothetical protein
MSQAEKPNSTSRLSRRSALAGLSVAAAAGVAALPACAAMGVEPDPIYALIEAHREAILAFGPAIERSEQMECDERDAFCSAASQREIDALVALLTTPPTTLAGVVAVLVHLGQPEWFKENPHEDERETILSGAVESTACEEARVFPLLLAATVRSLIGGGLW